MPILVLMARNSDESRALQVALQRFYDLAPADQLRAYEAIRDYLGEEIVETTAERRIAERTAALEAMRRAAQHLGLPDDKAPSPAQFDEASRQAAPGWNRSRVVRAWGRWRWAKRAFLGERMPEPARRKAHRRAIGPRRAYEGHVAAIRRWLATSPPSETTQAYKEWAVEYNDALRPGELRMPTRAGSIQNQLRLSWEDCVHVGKGELSLDEAPKRERQRRETFSRGPHNLISLETVLEILRAAGHGYVDVRTTYRRGFPRPVIVKGRKRIWLRDDIEAYAAGKPVPQRQDNELGSQYLDATEVAKIVGLSATTIKRSGSPRIPPPVANVAAFGLWLRSEIEEHFAAWQRKQPAG